MKVILLRDVAKIGRRFEVKEVPSGHALNLLIPRKWAEPATPEALRRLEVEMKKKAVVSERHDTSFKDALERLTNTPVTFALPANQQGSLFKGVHKADISRRLQEMGFNVQESEVVLAQPIKEIGEHVIPLRSGNLEGSVTLHITKA